MIRKMATFLSSYSYKGVQYMFLDTPVRLLEELKCPVCHELLSEPVVTSCKHLFCGKCIKDQPTCPTCRKEFTTTPDVGSTRVIGAFKVKCPNSAIGCEWEGDLGDAEEHLEKKCQQQKVNCPNGCGEKKKRKHLQNHTKFVCPNRSYKCRHCFHMGVYKDITTIHYTNCRNVPLLCPAGCRKKITRKNMESHLNTECPEEYISCKYRMFGCDTAVRRREKESHFSDTIFHLEKSMESQVAMFQSLGALFQSPTHIKPNVTSLPLSFRPWLQHTPTCYPRPPWVVKLEEFKEKKRNDAKWYSNPVHSHFGGYKICLCVYPNGNSDGKGTHVSVFIYLMKGDNDDNLKFPFKGHIVISLLNQLEDKNHHTREPWSPEDNISEQNKGRVTTGERNSGGFGYSKFIIHEDLTYNSDRNCQYLKNNCLFFRVDKIEPIYF